MKIEIEEIKPENYMENILSNTFIKNFNLKITINKKEGYNILYQKIYYGTIIKLHSSYIIDYDDDVPERLKVAVEQMVKFL